MSLQVSEELIQQAKEGTLDTSSFITCIKNSLPAAWTIFQQLSVRLSAEGSPVIYAPPTMNDADRGQLLRAMASNAIRAAVESHFEYTLAFQNCHYVAAFQPKDIGSPEYIRFVSAEAQVLAQRPELRDC